MCSGAVDDFIRTVDTKTLLLYLVGNDRLVATVAMPHDAIKKKGRPHPPTPPTQPLPLLLLATD